MQAVIYSPLCDTDPELYAAYLRKFTDGATEGQVFATIVDGAYQRWLGRGRAGVLGCAESGRVALAGRGLADSGDRKVDDPVSEDSDRGSGCGSSEGRLAGEALGVSVSGSAGGSGAGSARGELRGDVDASGSSEGGTRGGLDGLGPVAPALGSKTVRNRQWRADKKNRKVQRKAAGVDWRSRGEVRAFPEAVDESWVARKNAENKLKEMQALRQIELLQARDVEDEKRKQRARVLEQTERSKVNIERAYMSLRATGNVAGSSGGGSAETVFTGASVEGVPGLGPGDGSISPDSSVSLSEVREIQKRNLDLEKKSDDLEKELADLRKEIKRTGMFEALGCGREVVFTEYEGANSFGVAPSVAERLREMDENGEITHYVDKEFLGGVVVRRDLSVLYDAD